MSTGRIFIHGPSEPNRTSAIVYFTQVTLGTFFCERGKYNIRQQPISVLPRSLLTKSVNNLQELQWFLPKMTRSIISVHILALVSMRKYILNHK